MGRRMGAKDRTAPTGGVFSSAATNYSGPAFWELPSGGVYGWLYPPWLCEQMIEAVREAMVKALATGVAEYRVGSRSLRRFSLKELQDLLGFWTNMLEAGMYGGSIIARRGCPTDT